MKKHIILLSIPGLRKKDLAQMPVLQKFVSRGQSAPLTPSFPAVTCPVQANMTTTVMPDQHGVIANGFYWREKHEIEMWTAWNDCIQQPQLWDTLASHDSSLTSAVWFPLHSKGCGATYICTPAPIHNPDGSESLWCYTKPTELYGELRDALGHFPLKHFWGPMANLKSSDWIIDSAIHAAKKYQPNLFYIYIPHLDYAAQKHGPDSEPAQQALVDLDQSLGRLFEGFAAAYQDAGSSEAEPLWLFASEYTISPVDHVCYPNRILREADLLTVKSEGSGAGELIDFENSKAWALVDHQFSHVFVKDADQAVIDKVTELFSSTDGIAGILAGDQRAKYHLDHPRSGEVILISTPNSWQAYYYWHDDSQAPGFARTVDIHRKPGYDPVELHIDMSTKSIPLDATLIGGSHGAPAVDLSQCGLLLSNQAGVISDDPMQDTDVGKLVLKQFDIG